MSMIEFKNVWEMYQIKFVVDGKASWDNFWALKDVTFDVNSGETLGVIGENGAGKSTILKLIMDMLKPDKGAVRITGRVSGLLELGAGFQPELTGRENIYSSAAFFGLTKNQIKDKYDDIVHFASLGRFINAQVKCYSQGMFVRLAFAIAIHIDPDILLIDDTLAVGDEHFQRKCIKKIFELKEQGKTIIFVTHDMNMLRRLCKRAIFLKEGRIVRDAPVEKVIPLYTQMVGVKEGVATLENKPLGLVFNNGRLFFNWEDKHLTPGSGMHTAFYVSNKWYSSLQADWEVRKEGENKLLAIGKFYQLAFTQILKLELTRDNAVKLDIEIESEEPLEIQEAYINIMLTDRYARWFTTMEKAEFPDITDKDKTWQPLLDANNFRKCIGVEAVEKSGANIPSLAFEQSDLTHRNHAQILNSDYLSSCRVLQYKVLGLQNHSAIQSNRFVYFSGKITFNIQDIDSYLHKVQDETTLSCNKMRCVLDNGRAILYYNGINLTRAGQMNTSIFTNGRWYFSDMAHWEFKKEKENKLIARGSWPNLPLVQVWEIEKNKDTSFLWRVYIELYKEMDVEEQRMRFDCSKDYKYYYSDYGKGQFPGRFLEYEMDMLQRCIPEGMVGLQGQGREIPALSLGFSRDLNNFAKIFNSDFHNKTRVLCINKVEDGGGIRFPAGRHQCFKTEVILDKGKQTPVDDSLNVLEQGELRFIFDRGRGRIYWKDRELTKRLGLYTSLRSGYRWHDSQSKAVWDVKKRTKDTIEVLGRWLYLPIIQRWQIRLKRGNIIEFNVEMKVNSEVEVDRLQTNIMLIEQYKEWVSAKDKGFFSDFKGNIDDDWEVLWSNANGVKKYDSYVGVFKNCEGKDSCLPTVKFHTQGIDPGWCLNVVNADLFHKGRVLQCLDKGKRLLLPGEYPYYKGTIEIER
ncbi:MAG: ABC transporter ATP-binding protein [Candidatus Omnitrophica bacterium]|nr:ABC transporter ATP-binding protein [Candidatus Omnitrophota bacterium]